MARAVAALSWLPGGSSRTASAEAAPSPAADEWGRRSWNYTKVRTFIKADQRRYDKYDGSELAREFDRLFSSRYSAEDIKLLKADTFRELEVWLEKEEQLLATDHVDCAFLVQVARSNACTNTCLMIITLGLFYFFRPLNDLAILVLTKGGRVLLIRRVHSTGGSPKPRATAWALLRYLLILLTFSVLPLALCLWVKQFPRRFRGLLEILGQEEFSALKRFDGLFHHYLTVYGLILALFWIVFLGWVWFHRERGYGSRFRREYKSSYIAAAQYTLIDNGGCCNCCYRRRRRGALRLFFGKYPTQAELDDGLPLDLPASTSAIPLRSAASAQAGSTPNDAGGDADDEKDRAAGLLPVISFLLLICSLLIQAFAFYSFYEETFKVYEASGFCGYAKEKWECNQQSCLQYSIDHDMKHVKFCEYVKWKEDNIRVLRNSSCIGCVQGEMIVYFGYDDPSAWVESISAGLNYVTLFLALFTSGLVTRLAMSNKTETPCLEVEFLQDFFNTQADPFLMRSELAARFMDRVFESGDGREHGEDAENAAVEAYHEADLKDRGIVIVGGDVAPNWQKFLTVVNHKVVQSLTNIVHVPTACLGFMKKERVVQAWVEAPFLNREQLWQMAGTAIALAILFVYWPKQLGGPLVPHIFSICLRKDHEEDEEPQTRSIVETLQCVLGGPLLVCILTLLLLPLCVFVRYFLFFGKRQCAVIATTHRVFSLTYQPDWLAVLTPLLPTWFSGFEPGYALRVESFRHDGELFYGRMTSAAPSLFVRLCRPYRTGEVVVQSKFGVLRLERMYGDAEDLFNMVESQLSKDVEDLHLASHYPAGSLPKVFGVYGGVHKDKDRDDNVFLKWLSAEEDDPNPKKEVILAGREEELIYIWSFKETGLLSSPFDSYNDIVITTDRIRLASQKADKTFNCRTCCCWGFCWCASVRSIFRQQHLPMQRSFLNFSHMEAFSTESSVSPPWFPVRCPCYETFCDFVTSLVTCSRGPGFQGCLECPGTQEPLIQIWLKWMQRYAKVVQPDLMLSVRPYKLGRRDDVERGANGDEYDELASSRQDGYPKTFHTDQEEVVELAKLMRLVLKEEGDTDDDRRGFFSRWKMPKVVHHRERAAPKPRTAAEEAYIAEAADKVKWQIDRHLQWSRGLPFLEHQAVMRRDARVTLEGIVEIMQQVPQLGLKVLGYCGTELAPQDALRLSHMRAYAVKQVLLEVGLTCPVVAWGLGSPDQLGPRIDLIPCDPKEVKALEAQVTAFERSCGPARSCGECPQQ